jgi:excisionase family DNA binding protein
MVKRKAKKALEVSEMLTVQEAAQTKGVTEARVYQWIADGRLTKHVDARFGRTLVDRAELDALEPLRRGRPSKKGGKK